MSSCLTPIDESAPPNSSQKKVLGASKFLFAGSIGPGNEGGRKLMHALQLIRGIEPKSKFRPCGICEFQISFVKICEFL